MLVRMMTLLPICMTFQSAFIRARECVRSNASNCIIRRYCGGYWWLVLGGRMEMRMIMMIIIFNR